MPFKKQKANVSPHYHDTRTLLKKCRDVSWSLEVSNLDLQEKFKAEYGLSSDALLVDSEVNKGGNRLENYARALERSKKMMSIIDTAIDLMRCKHKKASSITGFCTTPISPRSSARMRVQFCSRSKPRESPFLCAPTMSTGMKLSRFSARFCGATPLRIARKSPICLPPIEPAQHPQSESLFSCTVNLLLW